MTEPAHPETPDPQEPAELRLGHTPRGTAANAVVLALTRAARSFLLYDPKNEAIRHFLDVLRETVEGYCEEHGDLPLVVRPFELVVDGLTTQAKYYKPLIYEFFRKDWRGARPSWGDFGVEIYMDYEGDPPWMDLDNLAKAILDAIKGYAFHDDAQVARLLVERRPGERERITVLVRRLS